MKTARLLRRRLGCVCGGLTSSMMVRSSGQCSVPFERLTKDDLQYKVIVIDNSILDFTAVLPTTEIHERYKLRLGSKALIDMATLEQIKTDAAKLVDLEMNPGGAGLNTVRVLKHLGTETFFLSAVGDDDIGRALQNHLEKRSIGTCLQVVRGVSTGQCLCLVYKNTNTLLASITQPGPSKKFLSNIDKKIKFLRPPQKKQIIYVTGFFALEGGELCRYVMENYVKGKCCLSINLSCPYFLERNFKIFKQLLQKSSIIFGNDEEFKTLAMQIGANTSQEAAEKLMMLHKHPMMCIITLAEKGAILLTNFKGFDRDPGDVICEKFDAVHVDNVVDTTGAGDVFAAGFLHALMNKKSLVECMHLGAEQSAQVITQVGCNLPGAAI